MGFRINIDTGGTFTDGFIARDRDFRVCKVLTTPHDFTVCFLDCVKEAAKLYNLTVQSMLSHTDIIKYSTTVGTNAIIEGTGSRIGLIVTKGYESRIYLSEDKKNSEIEYYVPRDLIFGITEEVNSKGEVILPVQADEVRQAVKRLVENGARNIVVSLKSSHLNNNNEVSVKDIVRSEYPSQYLGSMPLLISTDLTKYPDDAIRTNTAILNSYLHKTMVRYLYKAEESLRKIGYNKHLMVVHSSGGLARVAKTTALNTLGSGPVAGLEGCRYISKLSGESKILAVDMGGTSLDVGIVSDREVAYSPVSSINGFPVHISMGEIFSFAGGGGSIASVTSEGQVEVGPKSAGALPGPACFNKGGFEPTVTDADVVLGYLNPEYFFGGRMKLVKSKSEQVIEQKIARRLGCSIIEAAVEIKKRTDKNIAVGIKKILADRGIKNIEEFTMLAYGGAAQSHCCGFGKELGISKIITLPFSPVFCAFGVSVLDVSHNYQGRILRKNEIKHDEVCSLLMDLQRKAIRDMRGEGFLQGAIAFSVEIMATIEGSYKRIGKSSLLDNLDDLIKFCVKSLAKGKGERAFDIVLTATVGVPHPEFSKYALSSEDCSHAKKGTRAAFCAEKGDFIETNIYDRDILIYGNKVKGPAILEAQYTAYVIANGWEASVDKFANLIVSRNEVI